MSDKQIEDLTTLTATYAAVTAIDGKNIDVTAIDGTKYTALEIDTEDTNVIYVDTKNTAKAEGGSIQLADEPTTGNYTMNVFVVRDAGIATGNTLDAIFVDVNNEMKDISITMDAPTADKLSTALKSGNVTVKTLPTTGTVTVPAGKTLTVTGDNQTAAQLERVVGAAAGAKLVVKNDTTDNTTAGLFGSVSGITFTPISGAVIDDGTYVWTNVAAAGATASYKWVK